MTDLEWISQRVITPSEFSKYYRLGNKVGCTGYEGTAPDGVVVYSYADIMKHKETEDAQSG